MRSDRQFRRRLLIFRLSCIATEPVRHAISDVSDPQHYDLFVQPSVSGSEREATLNCTSDDDTGSYQHVAKPVRPLQQPTLAQIRQEVLVRTS